MIAESKKLRAKIYAIAPEMKDKMPKKREASGLIELVIPMMLQNTLKTLTLKGASKSSKNVTHGSRNKEDEFEYNKDAEMYVCKAGHMAIRKAKQGSKKDGTQVECYYFDVDKCKHCPLKDGCYKDNAKSKTYNVKIKNDTHIAQMDHMKTEEFKNYYSNRYKIEDKNSELKNSYNYDKANACGQSGITIQVASALFLANISRIYRLEKEKYSKNSQFSIKNHKFSNQPVNSAVSHIITYFFKIEKKYNLMYKNYILIILY